MSTFEPLRPRSDDFASPFDDEQAAPTFSPLQPQARPSIRQPMVANSYEDGVDPFGTLSGDFGSLPQEGRDDTAPDAGKSFRAGALHNIGVNWSEQTSDEERPFKSRLSFYELDYDATGDRAAKVGKSKDYVEAANVFGRQFTRAELEKDDEGRKLLKLMEAQRTGAHQDAGFWKGFTDWNLGNTPWLGWMMDLGTTVSESISISKAMRKMQNGDAVTNHEALSVRRFMLQQELEGQRSTGYQIGSTIRSSIPFVVEMAGATAMAAGTAKVAALAGTAIGGPVGTVVGGIIGAVGGEPGGVFGVLGREEGGHGDRRRHHAETRDDHAGDRVQACRAPVRREVRRGGHGEVGHGDRQGRGEGWTGAGDGEPGPRARHEETGGERGEGLGRRPVH